MSLGKMAVFGGSRYAELINKDGSTYNLQDAFGGEVHINGYLAEYVRIKTQGALTGVNNIYVHLRDHFKDEK